MRRKGLVCGIAWASTSLSGVGVPFFVSWCLKHFSFRTTLRIWSLVTVALASPLIPFIRPRVPTAAGSHFRGINIGFALSTPFLPLQVGSLLEGLGYFLLGIFLPSYASTLGLSNTIATVGVVLSMLVTFSAALL